jgi:hypothetical protein
MFKKPLLIATLASAVGIATLSTQAAAGDPVLGALIGGGIGAAIGHDVNRHGGAAVGGVLGAIVGSSIAADSGPYYRDGYYEPAPRYYAEPAYGPAYYGPAYYPAATVVYSSGPRYGYYGHRDYRRDYRGGHDNRRWH